MESSTSTFWTFASSTGVDYTKPWYTSLVVIFEIVALLNIFGNVLTIVAYAKTEQLQTPTNLLICNQSLIDALMSLAGQPLIWVGYTQWGITGAMENKWLCLCALCIVRITSVGSIVGILLLTIERSVAILCPFLYYTLITQTTVRRVIICSWVFCLLISNLPLLGWNTWQPGVQCLSMYVFPKVYNMFIITSFCFLCLICAAILNISIAVVAIKKNKVHDSSSAVRSGHIKVLKMLLKVVGVFYLCRMPYLLTSIAYTFTPIDEREALPDWFLALFDFSKALIGLNAVFNPLIYAHGSQQFREGFKRLLKINDQ